MWLREREGDLRENINKKEQEMEIEYVCQMISYSRITCKYCTWQISAILIERTCTGIEYPEDKLSDRGKLKSNREKNVKWLGKEETTNTANLKENTCQRFNSQTNAFTIVVFKLVCLISDSLDLGSHIGYRRNKEVEKEEKWTRKYQLGIQCERSSGYQ